MRMPKTKALTVLPPATPKILVQLDAWAGDVGDELELSDYSVQGRDSSVVRRLDIEGCKLNNLQLAVARLDKLQLSDSSLSHIEAAGMHAPKAALLRVVTSNSRLTGADFGAASFEDCMFENVKFDEGGLRFAIFKRVRFENCVLRNTDFSSAKLLNVSFVGCDFEGANFDNASCKLVDLRGEDLSNIKGGLGLKGATISSEQLIQLAPRLAAGVGLIVDYEQ